MEICFPFCSRSMPVDSFPDLKKFYIEVCLWIVPLTWQNLVSRHVCGQFPDLEKIRPVTPFFEKMVMSSHNENFFRNRDFRFEYVLDHSESIPTKKNFRPEFLSLPFFRPKMDKNRERFWRFLVKTKIFFKKFFVPLKAIFRSHSVNLLIYIWRNIAHKCFEIWEIKIDKKSSIEINAYRDYNWLVCPIFQMVKKFLQMLDLLNSIFMKFYEHLGK